MFQSGEPMFDAMRSLKHVNEIQGSLVKGKHSTQNDGVSFNLWVVMKLQ